MRRRRQYLDRAGPSTTPISRLGGWETILRAASNGAIDKSPLNIDALAEDIAAVALATETSVGMLTRQEFSEESVKFGGRPELWKTGLWEEAKKKALALTSETFDYTGEATPINPMPSNMRVKGVSTYQNFGDGTGQWTIMRERHRTREEIIEDIAKRLPTVVPVLKDTTPLLEKDGEEDLLAVYPWGDPHLGMLAWSKETLVADFDTNIAEFLIKQAMVDLVSRGSRTKYALLANLGDFFHADTLDNKTRRSGHTLDVDSRWMKILTVGINILVFAVNELLKHHEIVYVVNEIGNHDDHSAFMLSQVLDAHFHNNPRVKIDMSPARFHYHVFGANLIGIHHGHSTKHDDLESIMAYDQKDFWHVTEPENRWWLVGHIHHKKWQDYRNCHVESFRTLAPNDAWSSEAGYRSSRDMMRVILHRDFGEQHRDTVSARWLMRNYQHKRQLASGSRT